MRTAMRGDAAAAAAALWYTGGACDESFYSYFINNPIGFTKKCRPAGPARDNTGTAAAAAAAAAVSIVSQSLVVGYFPPV